MKYFSSFFLLLFFFTTAFSQFNTAGEIKKYYYEEHPYHFFEIDTSLKNFEEYNFENKDAWEYFNIGIIGSAEQSLKFEWNKRKGFKDGNIYFNNYKYDISNIKRYNITKFPYSELSYLNGSRLEQIAQIKHAQNIKNRFSFALDAYGMSGAGQYKDAQRTRNVAVSFYGIYSSKDNRYHLATDFSYSTVKTNETGGVVEDVLTESKELKLFHTTYLSNAVTEQNTLSFLIKNSYDLGFSKIDSVKDSLSVKRFYAVFKLKHSIGTNITNNSFLTKDTLNFLKSDFYSLKDSTFTKLSYHNIPHRIAFEYLGTNNNDSVTYKNIRAEIALQHNNLEIGQNGLELSTNNLMLEATIESNSLSGSKLTYGVNSYFIFTGFNKSDFHLKANLGYNLKKIGKISAYTLFENIRPSWIETFYHSKTKNWNNTHFSSKQIFEANFTYLLKNQNLRFEANLDLLSNYIYFDKNSTPVQTNSKITYWNVSIQKDSHWKIWHWNNFIGFQTSNHEEILPLPKVFFKSSLYAEFKIFKNNLLLSTGIDLRYNTSFKARAWNPVISQFYVQDIQQMNYTPVIDVFLNAKIKSVRIYAKLNYANEGLFVNNYYKALNYPSNGRTFSVGGSWRFFE